MGRGLFRLWLILTILWAGFVILATRGRGAEGIELAVEGILVPSGFLLIVGLMLRWALKGFSSRN